MGKISTKYGIKKGKGRVSVRQIRYLDNLKTAKTGKEAKDLAGYADSTPPGKIMEGLEGNYALKEAFADAGVTADYIARKYLEIMDKDDVKDSDLLRALETISKIRGDFAPVETLTKSINFEAQIVDAMDEVDREKKEAVDVNWDKNVKNDK